MYCLIKFVEDGIYYVTLKKCLIAIEGDLVWAPYKRLGHYEATVLLVNESRDILLEKQKKIERQELNEKLVKENVLASDCNNNLIPVDTKRNNELKKISDSNEPITENERSAETGLVTDIVEENEELSKPMISTHKRHFCFFCRKVLYQLPRHWFSMHHKEKAVKEIMMLHKNDPSRSKKINDLRKMGDFEYNKQAVNESKIVSRQSNKEDTNYLPCPKCLGYFNKDNLRHHRTRCSPNKGDRSLQGNERKMTNYIHERASDTLRNHIAPHMYQDEVTKNFSFDEIIILYGNYVCVRYSSDTHLKSYIRAQLRMMGRFMIQVKKYDPKIRTCKDLIHPCHIETIRQAIDDIASLDKASGIYKHPTNARNLSTELKKVFQVVESECDKKDDDILAKFTQALIRRYKLELAPYINRICKLSENKYKRMKGDVVLPENKEIEAYFKYLLKKVLHHYKNLCQLYSFNEWDKLCQYILVALIVFNRKRPGETQRMELDDFHKRRSVSKKDKKLLSNDEKLQADKYVHVAFRGKLGNSTALLIHKQKILPGLLLILKYRQKAGVHKENRFLFAFPSKSDKGKTYDAYKCHCKILEESGMNSSSLTFTTLRKQFATQVAKVVPSHEEELRVSNYMSHDFKIHKKIYDQSSSLMDITKISKHLEASTSDNYKEKYINEKRIRENASRSSYGVLYRGSSHSSDNLRLNEKNKHITRKISTSNVFDICQTEMDFDSDDVQCRSLKKKDKLNINQESKYNSISRNKSSESDESYIPNTSEEEIELEDVERCLGKFRRRTLWSSEEKNLVRNYFRSEIMNKRTVNLDKIKAFKHKYGNIVQRTIPMIKQWLVGEITKQDMKEDGIPVKRPRYSTPEKELLEKSFERHSLNGSDPSLEEVQDLINSSSILKERTAHSVLKKFQMMKKQTKK